jgi:hypothetical protein
MVQPVLVQVSPSALVQVVQVTLQVLVVPGRARRLPHFVECLCMP